MTKSRQCKMLTGSHEWPSHRWNHQPLSHYPDHVQHRSAYQHQETWNILVYASTCQWCYYETSTTKELFHYTHFTQAFSFMLKVHYRRDISMNGGITTLWMHYNENHCISLTHITVRSSCSTLPGSYYGTQHNFRTTETFSLNKGGWVGTRRCQKSHFGGCVINFLTWDPLHNVIILSFFFKKGPHKN